MMGVGYPITALVLPQMRLHALEAKRSQVQHRLPGPELRG